MEWLQNHAFESVYTAFIALLTGAFHWLRKKLKKQKKEQASVSEGVKALLHDRLYQACQFYIKQGWCSVSDKKNIEYMYEPYHDLGGNGTCEELFNQVLSLPLEEREER